ncbi:MAG: phenylalanine--tRNA ligase subunit beta [Candidatus Tectomicrobia bacterium]|uniref:Phenylalanine--tRNA ligase beta subunit n=1 Tax=Tectimicrobiota bacterium TaxID=2528274 RepID=A0A932M1J6_UNCTE|nr:phenylalanine--tRNA ligase subunit beta [Candidatus Tectomicrobia bacterium]
MKVSTQWLREYVDFNLSPEDLAEVLTMAGLEVESLTREGEGLEQVVVAEVCLVTKHPAADHLWLCQVYTGRETVEVVCGATNVESGIKAAFAPPGARLAGGSRVELQEIRGVLSRGMLCSAGELGIADDADGILILNSSIPAGTPLVEAAGLNDVILELSLTPNRPDGLGLVGVAREVAALTGGVLCLPPNAVEELGPAVDTLTSVSIADPDLCPRYTARVIQGVSVAPSPLWLQRRLRACGIRAINNVVDVTNYVLMETGHPLHAFDMERLREERIIVRQARSGEVLRTLDGVDRSLRAGMLVIADARDPVALAGIMGGKDSEVTSETRRVLLESAYFQPTGIRRTSKSLGLSTEASYRFERGADPEMASWASHRAAGLLQEIAAGKVCAGILDVYPRPIAPCRIDLRVGRTNRVLGTALDRKTVGGYLHRLGLSCQEADEDRLQVHVPTFRPDLTREIDLIEEVARLHGYNRIPSTLPRIPMRVTPRPTTEAVGEKLRNALEAGGFWEVITYSFIDERWLDRLRILPEDPRRTLVRLRNPLSSEQGVMRTTLVPGLLETVSRNVSRRIYNLRIFELGRVFLGAEDSRHLPREPLTLAGALTVRNERVLWQGLKRQNDFYDVKGVVEMLGAEMGDGELEIARGGVPFLDLANSAVVRWEGSPIGVCGLLAPALQEELDIHQPVALWEIDLEPCLGKTRRLSVFSSLPRYPAVLRDLAVVVDAHRSAGEVLDQIKKAGGDFLEEAILFDVFQGRPLPAGKRSLAFSLTFRAPDRTLTDEEVRLIQEEILARLQENLGAELR